MQDFRIAIGFLCIREQHKNMKYQAVHDIKSVHVVAFLGNNALICENDEKKQNNVSDGILQYLQTELLGLVKSGKFKRMKEKYQKIYEHLKGKDVKKGNYSIILQTEYGDIIIREDTNTISFPHNPNYYFIQKKSAEEVVSFILENLNRLSWPFVIPTKIEQEKHISQLFENCQIYKEKLKVAIQNSQCLSKSETEHLHTCIEQCIIEELDYYSEKFQLEYRGINFCNHLVGKCDSDNYITFNTQMFLLKPILIRYEILKLLCKTRYKKFNIDFWELLDACAFEAGITYATNFIVPELFKSPQNRYILMPFIGDLSRDNFISAPRIFNGSAY